MDRVTNDANLLYMISILAKAVNRQAMVSSSTLIMSQIVCDKLIEGEKNDEYRGMLEKAKHMLELAEENQKASTEFIDKVFEKLVDIGKSQ